MPATGERVEPRLSHLSPPARPRVDRSSRSASSDAWQTDSDGVISHLADRVHRDLGLPGRWLIGRSIPAIAALVAPADSRCLWTEFANMVAAPQSFRDHPLPFTTTAGEVLWFRVSGAPRRHVGGGFGGFRGRIERTATASDPLLTAVDMMPDAVGVYDQTLCLVRWNRAFVRSNEPIQDRLRPGMGFGDLIRAAWSIGFYPGDSDVDSFIREREILLRGGAQFRRVRPNGTAGLYRYLPLPGQGAMTLVTDITELERQSADLRRRATIDALTGVANRGCLVETATAIVAESLAEGRQTVVGILDLDHFKRINDTYGHAGGDAVLVSTAATAKRCLRSADLFGRLGGEEFAFVLTDVGLDEARHGAERLRTTLATTEMWYEDQVIRVTASIGLAEVGASAATFEQALALADKALYEAKDQGRNCVRVWR